MAAGRIMAAVIIIIGLTKFAQNPGFATMQASPGCGAVERAILVSATGCLSFRLSQPEMSGPRYDIIS